MDIRLLEARDHDALWAILEPVIREGETYTLPRDLGRAEALAYWTSPEKQVFVAQIEGDVVGTYGLRANQAGGGAHVANCGYMTAQGHDGKGVARTMAAHSLALAKDQGFSAMQFNFVVSTNHRRWPCGRSWGSPSSAACLERSSIPASASSTPW
jgi:RimJ/RimL family protein N-acetyltransferase